MATQYGEGHKNPLVTQNQVLFTLAKGPDLKAHTPSWNSHFYKAVAPERLSSHSQRGSTLFAAFTSYPLQP